MTTYGSKIETCSVCGASVECRTLKSTNAFGSPDLDLRPPEMQRSTMHSWLQECPECGYVNNDLNIEVENAKELIESESYGAIAGDSELPKLARRFALYSILQQANPEMAAVALIRAAWVCDDAGEAEQARTYRSNAADLLLSLQPFADNEEKTTLATVLVDVLRRAERFQEAKSLATSLLSFNAVKANKIALSVLQYQCHLCDAQDTCCHTVTDREQAGQKMNNEK